eukprot:1999-Heterococcus_DN1.PRE.1
MISPDCLPMLSQDAGICSTSMHISSMYPAILAEYYMRGAKRLTGKAFVLGSYVVAVMHNLEAIMHYCIFYNRLHKVLGCA